MKININIIKAVFFVTMITGLSATTQAEELPRGQHVTSNRATSNPTYVQEYQAITEVLNKYIEGCKQAKSSIMKPAFSAQATMYSVGADGKLNGGAIQGLFDGIDKGFRPSPDAPAAITRISFTDFFHLLKVEGKWTVVSKIFHTHSAE
jgi:hypothetical protein